MASVAASTIVRNRWSSTVGKQAPPAFSRPIPGTDVYRLGGEITTGDAAAAKAEGDDTADHESSGCRADDQLSAMLANLPPPVGQLVDSVAQRLHRAAEILPLGLDVATNLLGGAAGQPGRRGRNALRVAHSEPPSEPEAKVSARVDA